MTKKLRMTFMVGLGALLITLLCFAFLLCVPVSVKAEELNDNYDTTGITASYGLYSNGTQFLEDKETISRHTYISRISSDQLNMMKQDVLVQDAGSTKLKSKGMFYIMRTKSGNCVNSLDTYRDKYIVGVSGGQNFTGNTFSEFMSLYGEEIEYAMITYDFEDGEYKFETNSDLVFGRYFSMPDGASYLEAFFDITDENVNETFYYRSFFVRRMTFTFSQQGVKFDYKTDVSITGLSNTVKINEADNIREQLKDYTFEDDELLRYYNKLLGLYKGVAENVAGLEEEVLATINLHYKVYNSDTGSIENETFVMNYNHLYRNSPKLLAREIARNLVGFPTSADTLLQSEALPYFDVVCTEKVVYKDEESGYVLKGLSNEETRLAAKGIKFVDDFEDNDNVVDFYVEYEDFDHSDFYINLTNNDISNTKSLKVSSGQFEIKNGKGYLTFDFNRIERQANTAFGWLFDIGLSLEKSSFFTVKYADKTVSYTKISSGREVPLYRYTMENGGLVVEVDGDEKLTVIYDLKPAETDGDSVFMDYTSTPKYDLANLNIEIEAEILEDYKVIFEYRYLKIYLKNNEIVKTIITEQSSEPIYYSTAREFLDYESVIENFTEVVDALNLPFEFATIVGAKEYDGGLSEIIDPDTKEYYKIYGIALTYEYTPVFRIVQHLPDEDKVRFLSVNGFNSEYYGYDFVDEIPDGYRVKSISATDNKFLTSQFSGSWEFSKFYINTRISTDEALVIDVSVNYSDTYSLIVNYLKKYNDTPFGTYQNYNFTLPVKGYSSYKEISKTLDGDVITLKIPQLKSFTASTLVSVLGFDIDSLNAGVRNIANENGATSTKLTVNYNGRTVKQSYPNEDGISSITIPLTSFGSWCDKLGVNWDITYLNTQGANRGGSIYFDKSDEVNPNDLYGYFTLASFSSKSSWKKITDVELESGFTMYTYFVSCYTGKDLGTIRDLLGVSFFGDSVEVSKDKDYATFFTFMDTNVVGDGFVSVDGVVDITSSRIWFGSSGSGCSFGMLSCDNVGNTLFTVLAVLLGLVVIAVAVKIFRWAKR